MGIIETGRVIEGSGLGTPLRFAGVPVDGGAGTFAGIIAPGGMLIDTTNFNKYQNAGTQAAPVYKLVTRAA
jgi:hypothetical protein